MRRSLLVLAYHAIMHDPAGEVRPDETDDSGVGNALLQAVYENVVVDRIEEFLQVHIDYGAVARLLMRLGGQDRLVGAACGSKAVAVLAEAGI